MRGPARSAAPPHRRRSRRALIRPNVLLHAGVCPGIPPAGVPPVQPETAIVNESAAFVPHNRSQPRRRGGGRGAVVNEIAVFRATQPFTAGPSCLTARDCWDGRLAQVARAARLQRAGRGFKSLSAHERSVSPGRRMLIQRCPEYGEAPAARRDPLACRHVPWR